MSVPSLKILGGRVDAVSLPLFLSTVEAHLAAGKFLHVVTVNILMALASEKDAELQSAFAKAGLVVADSIGIALACRLKGFPIPARLPGIDLIESLCTKAEQKSWPVYFLGAQPGAAQQAVRNLLQRHPTLKIAGANHGYFAPMEEKEVLGRIKSSRARVVFVGMATPHQEKWIARNAETFAGMCVIGVGGSFDVLSGRLKRAPQWMQKLGLEWLYRLLQEPWRWKRMIQLPSGFTKIILK